MATIQEDVLLSCQDLGNGALFKYKDIKSKHTHRQVASACGALLRKNILAKAEDGRLYVRVKFERKMHHTAVFFHKGKQWIAKRTSEKNCVLIKSLELHREKSFKVTKLANEALTSVGYTIISNTNCVEMSQVYKSFSKTNNI